MCGGLPVHDGARKVSAEMLRDLLEDRDLEEDYDRESSAAGNGSTLFDSLRLGASGSQNQGDNIKDMTTISGPGPQVASVVSPSLSPNIKPNPNKVSFTTDNTLKVARP